MGWRASHGARRDTNGPVRIEVQPADELKTVNAEDVDARLDEAKRIGRPFVKGNHAGRGRRPKLARLGLDRTLDYKNKEYKSHLLQAETYRKRRVSEMKMSHGFVSVGAMSIMATAALQLAMSRFMMYQASLDDMDMDLIKKASGLANDARQNELAAWELCSREASAKTRLAANATPWLSHEAPKVRIQKEEKEELVQNTTLDWEVKPPQLNKIKVENEINKASNI